ncbi:MAG: hypothetical protein ABSG37_13035 [Candidatus Limnocylindrales bacterium]
MTANEDDTLHEPRTEAGRRLSDNHDRHAEHCPARRETAGPGECSCGLDSDILAVEAEARAGCESEMAALVEATENLQRAASVHWRAAGTRHRWLDDLLRADVAAEKLLVPGGLAAAAVERDARIRAEAAEAERERSRKALLDGGRSLDKSEALLDG